MAQLPKYYIVEAQALPEVFLKVHFTSIAIPSRRSRT